MSPKRGLFTASAIRRDLLATRPSHIDVETLKTYQAFAAFHEASSAGSGRNDAPAVEAASVSAATPEEQVDAVYSVLTAALKAELWSRILEQTPSLFERVIVDLLVAMGYGSSHENAAMRLGKSGDGDIDGIVDEDRRGLDRIYLQAKRFALGSSFGRPEIQAFVGSLVGLGATKSVFVTTSGFSTQGFNGG